MAANRPPAMRTAATAWLLLLSAALFWLGPVAGSCKFPAVFNFGDSNSDTGGFWAAFPAQPPPFGMTYFKRPAGRASDGRLVIDFIAQAMGLPFLSPYLQSIGSDFRHGANFATLASTATLPTSSVFVTGISPFSLAVQLNQMEDFRNRVLASADSTGWLPPPDVFGDSLYTIDIGQNDVTSNLSSQGVEGVKKILPNVFRVMTKTIQDLYNNVGARNIMVFNMAPVGCYPAFLVELPHNSSDLDEYGCMKNYNDAVLYYNEQLKDTLAESRKSLQDASIVYVDKHSVLLELFQHPEARGLKHGTKACCGYGDGSYNFNPRVYCGNSATLADGKFVTAAACKDPQSYVSWDGIHATEAANKMIAYAVISGSYSYPAFNLSALCELQPID